jgi:RNA polymerase sigma-70 factor (ECF subfamily)
VDSSETWSDQALVARVVADDDRGAFAELVRRHQSGVRSMLRKLACGDRALADDVAQEAFVRAYRRLSTFAGRARFSTWVCQIAYHAFLEERARAVRGGQEASGDAEPLRSDGSSRALLRHDVERALVHLSDAERDAIALTFGQDLTHEEAARILGCPLGTLKTNVARGLAKLERRLLPWKGWKETA